MFFSRRLEKLAWIIFLIGASSCNKFELNVSFQHDFLVHKFFFHNLILEHAGEHFWIVCILTPISLTHDVTTLTLGSWPRQTLAKVRAKRETWECGRVWKWTLTLLNEFPFLGVGVPMDFQIFKDWFQGSKPIGLRISLYHWNFFGT
jgi:hypothetical protein